MWHYSIWLVDRINPSVILHRDDVDLAAVIVQELEQNFNRLSDINVQLRKDKSDLGAQLTALTAQKTAVEKEMEKNKAAANTTENLLKVKLVS